MAGIDETFTRSSEETVRGVEGNRRWDDGGDPGVHLTYYFGGAGEDLNTHFTGTWGTSVDWKPEQQSAYVAALEQWENVADITFTPADSLEGADFVEFAADTSPTNAAARHNNPFPSDYDYENDPNNTHAGSWGVYDFSEDGMALSTLTPGGSGFQTLVHEIGHGLGLDHPQSTSLGSDVFPAPTSNEYNLDQRIFTVMSSNGGYDIIGTPINWNYGYVTGPSAFDIAAVQDMYGANTTYNSGNDIYVLGHEDGKPDGLTTIWDTGGNDTIVYNGTYDATIDLRAATLQNEDGGGGFVSYVHGAPKGTTPNPELDHWNAYTIAADVTNALADVGSETGVIIENATGGSGSDVVIGNAAHNTLIGNGGDDTLTAGRGRDFVDGGDDYDTAILEGNYEDYNIYRQSDGAIIVTNSDLNALPPGIVARPLELSHIAARHIDLPLDVLALKRPQQAAYLDSLLKNYTHDTYYNVENFKFADGDKSAVELLADASDLPSYYVALGGPWPGGENQQSGGGNQMQQPGGGNQMQLPGGELPFEIPDGQHASSQGTPHGHWQLPPGRERPPEMLPDGEQIVVSSQETQHGRQQLPPGRERPPEMLPSDGQQDVVSSLEIQHGRQKQPPGHESKSVPQESPLEPVMQDAASSQDRPGPSWVEQQFPRGDASSQESESDANAIKQVPEMETVSPAKKVVVGKYDAAKDSEPVQSAQEIGSDATSMKQVPEMETASTAKKAVVEKYHAAQDSEPVQSTLSMDDYGVRDVELSPEVEESILERFAHWLPDPMDTPI